MKYYSIILIIFLFASCTYKTRCVRCIDGDTIVTESGEHIRLAEIDANELHQPGGIEAKEFLSSLVLNKTIQVRKLGRDRYGRSIAKLYLNGLYINKIMVDSGEAWASKKYSSLYSNELEAQRKHLGLWKYNNIVSPIEWRHEHKH
jgi:micrococcal nuclease